MRQPGGPWCLGASAEVSSAEDRRRISGLIEAQGPELAGCILLETCHRVELYGFGDPPSLDAQLILLRDEIATVHLIRVASGLESAVIGEDEVLHQVREALRKDGARGRPDRRLHRLFEMAIGAGRRARAGRAASGAGLAGRAIAWLQTRSRLAGKPVVVAGAGRMGSALAHAAGGAGAAVTIASRDAGSARRLATVHGGRGVDLAEGARLAAQSAGIAIALGGVWENLKALDALPPIADISAPSAVPASVRARLNGSFLGIDALFVSHGPPARGYIEEAEGIVAAKAAEYQRWLSERS